MSTVVYGTPFSDHIDMTWGVSKGGNLIFAGGGNDWVFGWIRQPIGIPPSGSASV